MVAAKRFAQRAYQPVPTGDRRTYGKQIGHNGYQLLKNEFDVQKIAKQIVHTTGKENS